MVVTAALRHSITAAAREIWEWNEICYALPGWQRLRQDLNNVVVVGKYLQVTSQRGHVTRLYCKGRSHLVLQSEVSTHRVGGLIIKLDATQSQAFRIYCEWTNRCAGEAGLENSSAAWTRSGTTSEGDWRVVITSLEIKVELERIILSEIRRESAVLETIVEKPKSGSCHKLGSNLICKANSWSKIGLLRVA